MMMIDRRGVLAGTAALLAAPGQARRELPGAVAAIEATLGGGRLGLAAWGSGSGRRLAARMDERFAMCSTFKMPLAALVLDRIAAGRLDRDRRLAFAPGDVLDNSPATRAAADRGYLTVAEAAEAIVLFSDNSAANLLLEQVGGPAGWTAFARRHGDRASRLDRLETALGENLAGDPRDTSTPAAMLGLMRALLIGRALPGPARDELIGWMARSRTGLTRLRAGLPADWRVGDKTGAGNRGANNVVAIAWPPGRAPILIVSFVEAPAASPAQREAAHAAVGALVARTFA